MPAASAEKRARQRANKILRTETEATTLSEALPPSQTAESTSLPTPAPISFTITYSLLSISYPEPVDLADHLLLDAVQVTRNELAMMLCQLYIHSLEHGWKMNIDTARECLQADYEKDMQDGTEKFAEHEKQIRAEEFTHGFNEAQTQFKTQHEEKIQLTLVDIFEHQQEWRDEEYIQAFSLGHTTGIQDEREYLDSVHITQTDVGTQVKPTMAAVFIQSDPPIISPSSSATISTQTEPLLPAINPSEPLSASILEFPTPTIIVSAPLNWADDAISLPTIPIIPPKQLHDLSSLHSSSKNPFSSLRHRHRYRYPKYSHWQAIPSRSYTQLNSPHPPLRHNSPSLTTPLDWHHDPCLFELSHVLRTLGWSYPSS